MANGIQPIGTIPAIRPLFESTKVQPYQFTARQPSLWLKLAFPLLWTLRQLWRPGAAVTTTLYDLLGGEPGFHPARAAWQGFSLKDPKITQDILGDILGWRPEHWTGKVGKFVTGLAGDIALDPLFWLTRGAGGAFGQVFKKGAVAQAVKPRGIGLKIPFGKTVQRIAGLPQPQKLRMQLVPPQVTQAIGKYTGLSPLRQWARGTGLGELFQKGFKTRPAVPKELVQRQEALRQILPMEEIKAPSIFERPVTKSISEMWDNVFEVKWRSLAEKKRLREKAFSFPYGIQKEMRRLRKMKNPATGEPMMTNEMIGEVIDLLEQPNVARIENLPVVMRKFYEALKTQRDPITAFREASGHAVLKELDYYPHILKEAWETGGKLGKKGRGIYRSKILGEMSPSDMNREYMKFISPTGELKVGNAEIHNLQHVRLTGIEVDKVNSAFVNDVLSAEELANAMGWKIRFWPKKYFRGRKFGEADHGRRLITVATKGHTREEIASYIVHELGGGHAWEDVMSGIARALRTPTQRGWYNKLLKQADNAYQGEWQRVYELLDIDLRSQTPYFRNYFSQPGEVHARVAELIKKYGHLGDLTNIDEIPTRFRLMNLQQILPEYSKLFGMYKAGAPKKFRPLINEILEHKVYDINTIDRFFPIYRAKDGSIWAAHEAKLSEIEKAMQELGKIPPNSEFFSKNLPLGFSVMMNRHARTYAGATFLEQMKQFGTFPANREQVARLLSAGMRKVGGKGVQERLRGFLFHPEIADVIETSYRRLTDMEEVRKLISMFDSLQNPWKRLATVVNMGFHFRNYYSNLWQGYLHSGADYFRPKNHILSAKVIMEGKLQELAKLPKGAERAAKVRKFLKGIGINLDEVVDTSAGGMSISDLYKAVFDEGVAERGLFGIDIPMEVGDMMSAFGDRAMWRKAIDAVNVTTARNPLIRYGRNLGRFMENEARIAGYLTDIRMGVSARKALERVKKFWFDYGEITDFERNVMRRVIPFYTWIRKNIPLQLEEMAKQPGKFALIQKARAGLGRMAEEEFGPEEPQFLPKYFRELFAMRTPFQTKLGNPLYFNPNLPFQDINRMVDPMGWMSALSPIFKIPLEAVFRKETFTERPIESWARYTTMGVPKPVAKLFGGKAVTDPMTGETTTKAPYWANWALRQVPFFYNIAISLPAQRAARGAEAAPYQMLSRLAGIKMMPFRKPEQMRNVYYEELRKIRSRIRDIRAKQGALTPEEQQYFSMLRKALRQALPPPISP